MPEIKRATAADAALIASISRETFYETFAEYNTKADMDKFLSTTFATEQLIKEASDPGNIFFLAFDNTICAGYLFMHDFSVDTIEIAKLYARTSFIGKGIGKSLMQTAIDFAKMNNKNKIRLGVWEHNHRAITFYQSFGFEKTGEQEFILGDDVQNDWVMEKNL